VDKTYLVPRFKNKITYKTGTSYLKMKAQLWKWGWKSDFNRVMNKLAIHAK